jgi:hypothetical protein
MCLDQPQAPVCHHGPAETQRHSHLKSSRRTSELAPPPPPPRPLPHAAPPTGCVVVCVVVRVSVAVCVRPRPPPVSRIKVKGLSPPPQPPQGTRRQTGAKRRRRHKPKGSNPKVRCPFTPPPSSPPSPPSPPPPQHAWTCMAAVNVFVSGLQPDMLQRKEAVTPATATLQTVVTRTRKEHAAALPTGKGTEGPREDGKREVVLRTVSLCAWGCGWFSVRVCPCVCHSCGSCAFVCGVVAFPDGLPHTTRASRTIESSQNWYRQECGCRGSGCARHWTSSR